MKNIDQLLAEADNIIEKRASSKTQVKVASVSSDEVDKLASMLDSLDFVVPQEKVANKVEIITDTPFEKVARSLAITEALMNIEEFRKLAEFEDKARASGYTEAKISEYIEKKASETVSPLARLIDLLG